MRLAVRTKARAAVSSICVLAGLALGAFAHAAEEPPHSAALDAAIVAAAKRHGVPERLVRRIIMRESKYNPKAHNRAFWGLMQISYPTAQSMGFKGTREELLNPFVNLRYAVPYLANAFVIAGKQDDAAVRLYAAGYYFTAKSKGLLDILRTADSPSLSRIKAEPPPAPPVLAANAVVRPPRSIGFFGALFGPGRQPAPPPAQTASLAAPPADGAKDAAPTGAGMVADASGSLEPPKKWKRDGGVTIIARGEQAIEQLAERAESASDASGSAKGGRPHKITLVASLDAPPASQTQTQGQAQAYAAPTPRDPRLAGAPSQAAIADATSAPASSMRTSSESAEIPTRYEEPEAFLPPVKAKPAKKLAKRQPPPDKKTARALAGRALAGRVLAGRVLAGRVLAGRVLAGKEPLASGRSEAR